MKIFQAIFWQTFIFISCLTTIDGQSIDSINEQVTNFYKAGKYKESLALWNELLSKDVSDPDLYFNIGNAESMLGNIANAILNYEYALRYRPGDQKIKQAINNARANIQGSAIPINSFFLNDWIRNAFTLLRPGMWALGGLILMLTGVFLWLASIHAFGKMEVRTKITFGYFLFGGFILLMIAYLSFRQIHQRNEAIIFSECDFHEAPTQESPLTRSLHPGEKIRILDQIAGWHKVNLLNLDEGWIKEDCFVRIQPGKKR